MRAHVADDITSFELRHGSQADGSPHVVTVESSWWDSKTGCVVLFGDRVKDDRSIALTAQEARRLARALSQAADQVNPLALVEGGA